MSGWLIKGLLENSGCRFFATGRGTEVEASLSPFVRCDNQRLHPIFCAASFTRGMHWLEQTAGSPFVGFGIKLASSARE